MRAAAWFRATGVVLLLFAAGHTLGFLKFRPATAAGLAVLDAMQRVYFAQGSRMHSYGEFYRGFGLFISAFYLFTAWLAWSLGSMSERALDEARRLAWGLVLLQCVGLGLAFEYFGGAPAVLSVVTVVCMGMGLVSLRRQTQAAPGMQAAVTVG
jgi:hypothetical protein